MTEKILTVSEAAGVLDCVGYRSLLAAVEVDEKSEDLCPHSYREKLNWVLGRVHHYADKTGLSPERILDRLEEQRKYWYMNYYQESNMPSILGDGYMRVFDSNKHFLRSVDRQGFRCPSCKGVSKSAYVCDTGIKDCDWKVFGLFQDMGVGAVVFVKDKVVINKIFKPVAWEE